MTDLHDRIRAAIEARRERAQAAATDSAAEWYCYERYVEAKHPHPQIFDADEEPVLWLAMDGTQAVMDHIAAEDPATVLRHCDEDQRTLGEHAELPDSWGSCTTCRAPDSHGPGGALVSYPCEWISSLARRYEIEENDRG
jgi:hypothetical protein